MEIDNLNDFVYASIAVINLLEARRTINSVVNLKSKFREKNIF